MANSTEIVRLFEDRKRRTVVSPARFDRGATWRLHYELAAFCLMHFYVANGVNWMTSAVTYCDPFDVSVKLHFWLGNSAAARSLGDELDREQAFLMWARG